MLHGLRYVQTAAGMLPAERYRCSVTALHESMELATTAAVPLQQQPSQTSPRRRGERGLQPANATGPMSQHLTYFHHNASGTGACQEQHLVVIEVAQRWVTQVQLQMRHCTRRRSVKAVEQCMRWRCQPVPLAPPGQLAVCWQRCGTGGNLHDNVGICALSHPRLYEHQHCY